MKRIYAVFFLLLMLSASSAQAEGVWVEETWEHVSRELDCDGLPMTVDAEVFSVTPCRMKHAASRLSASAQAESRETGGVQPMRQAPKNETIVKLLHS